MRTRFAFWFGLLGCATPMAGCDTAVHPVDGAADLATADASRAADEGARDQAGTDQRGSPDDAAPDLLPSPDGAAEDLPRSSDDLATSPDGAAPDSQAPPDLAVPDLARPPDVGVPPDLAPPADLAVRPDGRFPACPANAGYGGVGKPDGGFNPCGETGTCDGHVYALDCDGTTCVCSVDKALVAMFVQIANTCQSLDAAWHNVCGF